MRWLVVSAVGAISPGCGGSGTPDGGSGGGGGGSGGGSTGGGSGGGGTLGGTLVGLAAVPVNAVSAHGLVGTITVTRLDATSSAGSFSTTMSMVDGGSSALSGSWDTVNCP